MELVLSRGSVRDWRTTDAERLAAIANDRDIWRQLRDRFPHPYAPADALAYIARAAAPGREHAFAICRHDVVAGAIGLTLGEDIYRRTAEVGYWLGAEARGHGLATEALSGFTTWAFATFDVVRLQAAVFVWNGPSARVLEKAGFVRESLARSAAFKDGQVLDEWIYAMVR